MTTDNRQGERTLRGRILALYYAQCAEDAIDKLWDEGKLNDEVVEGWKHEHMRTPYLQ